MAAGSSPSNPCAQYSPGKPTNWLSFREEIVTIDLLDLGGHLFDAGVGGVTGGEVFGDALQRLGLIRHLLGERMDGIALDGGDFRADATEAHGEVDGVAGGLVAVSGAIVAIHAVHAAKLGL